MMMTPDPHHDFPAGLDSVPISSLDDLDFPDDIGDFHFFDDLHVFFTPDTDDFPILDATAMHLRTSEDAPEVSETLSFGAPKNLGINLHSDAYEPRPDTLKSFGIEAPENCRGNHNASSSASSSCNRESLQISTNENLDSHISDSSQVSRSSNNHLLDQRCKLEEESKIPVNERKYENEGVILESRVRKRPRSDEKEGQFGQDVEKRRERLMRNRESAQLSRERKRQYIEKLEDKVRAMKSTIAELNGKVSHLMTENLALRQQLGFVGVISPPPIPPMPYPWTLWGSYMFNPQMSRFPRVPLPCVKAKQPVSCPKVKNSGTKSGRKIQKIASVTFLGVLLFWLLFGGLLSFQDGHYGVNNERIGCCHHRDRVLKIDGHANISDLKLHANSSDNHWSYPESVSMWSQPLSDSLYVPKNNYLVKLDGKLIVNSIRANEKASVFKEALEISDSKRQNAGLLVSALAIPNIGRDREAYTRSYSNMNEKLKALVSAPDDKKVQEGFHDGIAGPLLSSSQCTEVFQFDTSQVSNSGAIVAASSDDANVTAPHKQIPVPPVKTMNRRILREVSSSHMGSGFNISEELRDQKSVGGEPKWKKAESVVVSILTDPREMGDGDTEGMMASKPISRIFVVVLLDSVKYVTYSCMLPGTGAHRRVTS